MNYTIIPNENRTESIGVEDAAAPGDVTSYRRISSSIIDDLCKFELWSEFKRKFAEIRIHDRTIDSLALIPLLETALDDGAISLDEKNKILCTMEKIGLLTTGIDPSLNNLWVSFKGRTAFLIVWTVYLRDVSRLMPPQEKAAFKSMVTEAWEFMVRTIGGFLKIPDLDKRMMIAIESAFCCGEGYGRLPDKSCCSKGEYHGNKSPDLTRSQGG